MNKKIKSRVYIHPTAYLETGVQIGEGTKIWHEVHVRRGVQIGRYCNFGKGAYIDIDVRIGDRVKVQNYACVYKNCVIADDVFIGPHVIITNDLYPRAATVSGRLKRKRDWVSGTTLIKKGAAIGAASVILPDIKIGEYSMIGAGAVVTNNVLPHTVMVGNPATITGYICSCGKVTQRQKPRRLPFTCDICRNTR